MPSPVLARLRDGRTIGAVLRGRSRFVGDRLVLHAARREDEGASRLAVVASRRVGGAVQRNRAKRLLREAARSRSWAGGYDLVLVARAGCAQGSLAGVVGDLDAGIEALGLAVHGAAAPGRGGS